VRSAIAVVFFTHGVLFATWASRIPDVKQRLVLSEATLGFALLALGLGTFAALPCVAWLIARFGGPRLAVTSALACFVALPLAGLAPSFPPLCAALALFGAALGSLDVAMNAEAVRLERAAGRSIMSSFHGLWSAGGVVGAGVGGGFAARAEPPWAHFMAVCGVLAVVVFLVNASAWHEPPPIVRRAPALAWPSGPVVAIGLVGACGAVVEGGIADWSGVYLRDVLASAPGFAALGFAAFSLAMMAGRFAGDRLIDRFGRRTLLRSGALASGCAIAAALLWGQPSAALLAFVVAGLGVSVVFPIAFGMAGDSGAEPGHAIAAVATMAYGGGLLGPPIIGFVAGAASLEWALGLLVLASFAIAALTSVRVARRLGAG
jgi:MFS family permease